MLLFYALSAYTIRIVNNSVLAETKLRKKVLTYLKFYDRFRFVKIVKLLILKHFAWVNFECVLLIGNNFYQLI